MFHVSHLYLGEPGYKNESLDGIDGFECPEPSDDESQLVITCTLSIPQSFRRIITNVLQISARII